MEVAGSALVEEAEVVAFALACASHDGNFGVVALGSTVAATGRPLGAVVEVGSTLAALWELLWRSSQQRWVALRLHWHCELPWVALQA